MADNIAVKDASGVTINICTKDVGGGLQLSRVLPSDATGVAYGVSNPLEVAPLLLNGGNLSVQTAATGTNYTAFASQVCCQLTLVNNTGTTIEFRQGGAGVAVPVFDQSFYTIFGITNANQISIRRTDTGNTQVTAQARWEA